ncbi:unnamed protein product [Trichobilharzia szidati]|nr:unnamed protein product [Trichobilharzia szidati]
MKVRKPVGKTTSFLTVCNSLRAPCLSVCSIHLQCKQLHNRWSRHRLHSSLYKPTFIIPRFMDLLYGWRWERQDEISAALKAGISVVVDRYSYSGIANTAAKFHPLSEADWQWCRSTESGLLQPDFIFCLAPENFAEITVRDGFGEKKFETPDFQKQVLINYGRLSREMESELNEAAGGDAATETKDLEPRLWHWIPATGQTVDDTHSCIMAIIDPKL